MTASLWTRARGKYIRTGARLLFRRPLHINSRVPLISFTFDDFPRSAVLTGGAILEAFGVRGTFYAALGLLGKEAPTGTMFREEDLQRAVDNGHELGCHTFAHCDAFETATTLFERSVLDNRRALNEILPGSVFKTLSYPINPPRVHTKKMISRYFNCVRGGGQRLNSGVADLNCLSAFFLEKSRDDFSVVKKIIEQNREANGWLIFATHDVSQSPTPYGCTPDFFKMAVQASLDSGARILPVAESYELLRSSF